MTSNRFLDAVRGIAASDEIALKYADYLQELFSVVLPKQVDPALSLALEKEDAAEAVRILASYYRAKPDFPTPELSAKGRYNPETADRATAGIMREVSVDWTFPDGEVDFLFNPTEINGPVNHEWLWQFNRHSYWIEMARAYTETGDEKYARAFCRQLLRWVAQTYIPEGTWNNPGSAWRTIECGLRLLGSWQVAFDGFRTSESVGDAALLLMIAAMHRQAVHLVEHPRTGNWLMMESNGLYTFSALFPELSDSKEHRNLAAERLLRELDVQLLPDGMQYELSPDYHSVVFHCSARFYCLATALGTAHEIPQSYLELLRKASHAAILLSTPAFTQPRTNDCFTISTKSFTRDADRLFPDDEACRFVNTDRKEGTPPTEGTASAFLPYAGFAAMRSDWGPDATYLCFDVGPLGVAHVHQDKLSINLYKGCRELIYDDGGGQYDKSDARVYALSGYGHNTALVDGFAQNRSKPNTVSEPIDAKWVSDETHDYAVGVYDDTFGVVKHKLATHKREVLFCKPDFFCITDTLSSADGRMHDYEILFHLDTTSVRKLTGLPNALISDFGANSDTELIMIPLDEESRLPTVSCVSGATVPMMRGWYNGRNDKALHKAITVSRKVEDAVEYRFTTLLFPVKQGGVCPSVDPNGDGTFTVRFNGKKTVIDPASLSSYQGRRTPAMNIRKIAVTRSGQDGAIYGDLLFRFDHLGKGAVYDLSPLKNQEQCEPCELPVLSELMLDRVQELAPHSNSVVFGSERFDPRDELPLLYTNIYNNYAKAENPLVGVCCVYRVLREGNCFSTRLVQCIEIGFTDDTELWRSGTDTADVRPYGNFVIDPTADRYYAFVMRDAASSVRYFSFRLPRLSEGVPHPTLGIPWVTLTHSDILGFFDTPYHNYIQGAAVAPDGRIYSVEGFGKNPHPAIRIINPHTKTQELFFDFYEAGLPIEAELIDFYHGRCLYGDAHGNLFELTLLP